MTVKTLRTLLVLFALSGIGLPVRAGMVTRTVQLPVNVTRIYLNGPNELHLTQGDAQFVKLTAPQEMVSRVKARVKGRSLYLGREINRGGNNWEIAPSGEGDSVRFDVQLARIDAIRILGSGNAVTGAIVGERLKIIMYGNGKADTQSIKARSLRLELSGKCDFRGGSITAEDGNIQVAGLGKIDIKHMEMNDLDIHIGGKADIALGNLAAAKLDTEINGAANLDLSGRVGSQYLEVNGSGDFHASKLISSDADIDIRGAGDIELSVQKLLTAEITRGANLVYYGGPELKTDISGRGKFHKAGDIPQD